MAFELTELSPGRAGSRRRGITHLVAVGARPAVIALEIFCIVVLVAGGKWFMWDFRGDLYVAGRAIVHGTNPYQLGPLEAQASVVRAGGTPRPHPTPRWPPPVLLAAVPLSLLPFQVAGWFFVFLSIGAIIVALRLLGVRDWRCIGVALLSWPAVWGSWLGNISALLLLGTALAWWWRSRLWTLACVVASVIAAKLWLWPLAAWLLVTRRYRALVVAVSIAGVGTLAAWALIGFAGLTSYPHMLALAAYVGGRQGSSLLASLLWAGLPVSVARGIALLVAAGLIAAAWRLAGGADGDRRAFGLVVMAALIATPMLWPDYLLFLFVPIALLTNRFSSIWFMPMLAGHPHRWTVLPDLALQLIVIAWLCSPLLRRSTAAYAGPDLAQLREIAAARLRRADTKPSPTASVYGSSEV